MITETKIRRIEPDITVVEITGRLSLGNSLISVESLIRRLVEEANGYYSYWETGRRTSLRELLISDDGG